MEISSLPYCSFRLNQALIQLSCKLKMKYQSLYIWGDMVQINSELLECNVCLEESIEKNFLRDLMKIIKFSDNKYEEMKYYLMSIVKYDSQIKIFDFKIRPHLSSILRDNLIMIYTHPLYKHSNICKRINHYCMQPAANIEATLNNIYHIKIARWKECAIQNQIHSKSITCRICLKQVALINIEEHTALCKKHMKYTMKANKLDDQLLNIGMELTKSIKQLSTVISRDCNSLSDHCNVPYIDLNNTAPRKSQFSETKRKNENASKYIHSIMKQSPAFILKRRAESKNAMIPIIKSHKSKVNPKTPKSPSYFSKIIGQRNQLPLSAKANLIKTIRLQATSPSNRAINGACSPVVGKLQAIKDMYYNERVGSMVMEEKCKDIQKIREISRKAYQIHMDYTNKSILKLNKVANVITSMEENACDKEVRKQAKLLKDMVNSKIKYFEALIKIPGMIGKANATPSKQHNDDTDSYKGSTDSSASIDPPQYTSKILKSNSSLFIHHKAKPSTPSKFKKEAVYRQYQRTSSSVTVLNEYTYYDKRFTIKKRANASFDESVLTRDRLEVDCREVISDLLDYLPMLVEEESPSKKYLKRNETINIASISTQITDTKCFTSIKDFRIIKPISKGSYGCVCLAQKVDSGDYFALKILDRKKIIEKNQIEYVENEKNILINMNNDYVVKCFYTFQTDRFLFFVLDFMVGGDLGNLLSWAGAFYEEDARFYLAEVIQALEYLHFNHIIHRDLKPDNLLVSSNGHIKLTDFGLSEIGLKAWFKESNAKKRKTSVEDNFQPLKTLIRPSSFGHFKSPNSSNALKGKLTTRKAETNTIKGTPNYIAPEIIMGGEIGYAIDFWALGIITFQMLLGYLPFMDSSVENIFDNIIHYRLPVMDKEKDQLSAESIDLIKALLNPNPHKRLGFNGCEQLKKHPFFKGVNWGELKNAKPPQVPEALDVTDSKFFDSKKACFTVEEFVKSNFNVINEDWMVAAGEVFKDFNSTMVDSIADLNKQCATKIMDECKYLKRSSQKKEVV